ncbi:MAG: HAD-IA family hydrolase [Candidatus Aenigmarchaeota archaeon]|nr:HAD-IA family hydrolase [Candidatus Aenigmarchaeota archaeon]MDI6722106.1 HAD-IA family hydrolase [Candidatus Aenigmarchaeota archaeon]
MIKYAIFDNDGTLYRMPKEFPADVVGRMISFLSSRLDKPEHEIAAERKRLIEREGVSSTEYVFGKEYEIEYDEFLKNTYLSVELEKYGICRDERLRSMLEKISLPKSVLTNNPSEFARKILTSIGIEDMFEYIIGSREMNYQLKPRKEAFLNALEITGYDPEETIFIDDIPEFHIYAKELGITTVLVGQKAGGYPHIDHYIEEIYDLNRILGGESDAGHNNRH